MIRNLTGHVASTWHDGRCFFLPYKMTNCRKSKVMNRVKARVEQQYECSLHKHLCGNNIFCVSSFLIDGDTINDIKLSAFYCVSNLFGKRKRQSFWLVANCIFIWNGTPKVLILVNLSCLATSRFHEGWMLGWRHESRSYGRKRWTEQCMLETHAWWCCLRLSYSSFILSISAPLPVKLT